LLNSYSLYKEDVPFKLADFNNVIFQELDKKQLKQVVVNTFKILSMAVWSFNQTEEGFIETIKKQKMLLNQV
jgi:hypothetical protein